MSVETRRAEREPKTETEKALQAQKAKEGLKAMAIGPVTGVLGLPSDIIDLADMANDAIAKYGKDTTIAQFSKLIKPQLDRLQEKYGREQFDKGFTELTGIKSDVSRPAQMLGELVSLGGIAKAGVKGAKVIGEGLSDAYKGTEKLFETQTDLLTKGPTGGSGGAAVETAGVGQLDQTKKLLKDEQKAITTNIPTSIPAKELINAPKISPTMAGLNTPTGQKQARLFEDLEKQGNKSPEELFTETGVYRGQDGKLRYEIDDRNANLKKMPKEGDEYSLYEILQFDDLYKEYFKDITIKGRRYQPIRNVKVRFIKDYKKSFNASYITDTDSILINLENFKPIKGVEEKITSSLLHEIQHAVQRREGFERGTNVTAQLQSSPNYQKYSLLQKLYSERNFENRKLIEDTILPRLKDKNASANKKDSIVSLVQNEGFGTSFDGTVKAAKKDALIYDIQRYTDLSVKEIQALKKEIVKRAKLQKEQKKFIDTEDAIASEKYYLKYGEREARLVQDRYRRRLDLKKFDLDDETVKGDLRLETGFLKGEDSKLGQMGEFPKGTTKGKPSSSIFDEMESELKFKKFGKGLLIDDGSKKGFGSIKPLANKDQKGNKFELKVNSGIPEKMLNDPKNLGVKTKRVKTISEAKEVANNIFKKDEGLSPVQKKLKEIDYMGADVFHATTKDFKTFGFVSKNNQADIGFHVGKPNQASARVDGDSAKLGARTLPLKLKRELKPARIPDLGSFKEPSNWLRNIAFTDKDPLFRIINDTPEGRASIKKQIEDNIPLKMGDKTYYMLPDLMKGSVEDIGFKNKTIDKGLWKDLVLESTRAIRTGLDTTKNFKDRQEWFDTIKKVANKNGYDSYVYRNEYEGQVFDTLTGTTKRDDSFMLLEPDQAKGRFGGMTKGEPDFMKSQGGLLLSEGGKVMKKQMELFEEGGLKDEGNTVDPVSGNDVPPGATQEEVRDDIPARLSEGEFVFPADVVRYWGLETLMKMRQEAKAGLARMEAMGQMGNSDEATIPDNAPFNPSQEDLPFTMDDLDTEEEMEYNEGGVVKAQTGTFVQPSQFQGQPLPSSGTMPNYVAPNIPPPAPAPVGGFTPQFTAQTGQAGQQTTAPTFQTLLGKTPGQYDEMREYVNEAGAKLQIPFKDGQPIYPIPEGYSYVDPEATKTEEVTTKEVTPQTTQVTQQQEGDSALDDRVKQQNVENFGVEDPTVISLGGQLDEKGLVTKSMEFSYNVKPEGGLLSTSLPMSLGKSIASIVTGRSMVGDRDVITLTPKGYPEVKVELTGKEFKDMVNVPTDDGKGKKISITNKDVQNFLNTKVQEAIDVVEEGKFQDQRSKGTYDPDTQTYSSEDAEAQKSYEQEANNQQFTQTFGDSDVPSVTGQDFSQDAYDDPLMKQGGLASKKKPKVKKMKRGGLASR